MAVDSGRGAPWVLLHGWGMGASVFAGLQRHWPAERTILRPDLPGCGRRRAEASPEPIAAIAESVLATVDRPARWIGWSLGGLVALEAARQAPQAVTGVTLVAASPRMAAAPEWPGIAPAELATFRREVVDAPAATHARFLALQVRGARSARATLRSLRQTAATDRLPGVTTLAGGLDCLSGVDLRTAIATLECPVDAVLGACDRLVPVTVAAPLRALGIDVQVIAGAGHAPFLSHPDEFAKALNPLSIVSERL